MSDETIPAAHRQQVFPPTVSFPCRHALLLLRSDPRGPRSSLCPAESTLSPQETRRGNESETAFAHVIKPEVISVFLSTDNAFILTHHGRERTTTNTAHFKSISELYFIVQDPFLDVDSSSDNLFRLMVPPLKPPRHFRLSSLTLLLTSGCQIRLQAAFPKFGGYIIEVMDF